MSNKYEKRGVSAKKEDVHQAIKGLSKGLYPNAFCKILPDHIGKSEDHCVIMHADTAGTKSSLAYIYWKETGDLSVWEGIVQDAMVMNLDDMACSGMVDDIVISATLGRNKHLVTGDVVSTIIRYAETFVSNMRQYGVQLHLAGGETADVGDIVRTADVGYTAFGRMRREDVISIDLQPGDYIVGLASYGQASYESHYNSGMGCNGLTSARHDIFAKEYASKYPESFDPGTDLTLCYSGTHTLTESFEAIPGLDYGKLVLSPTRTYLPFIKAMLNEIPRHLIHGMVHNTGGGQYKVNHFNANKLHIVKNNLLAVPPLFEMIHRETGVPYSEMFQVFNMGVRLEIYTPDKDVAAQLVEISQAFDIDAAIIGRVEKDGQAGVTVIHQEESYFQAS